MQMYVKWVKGLDWCIELRLNENGMMIIIMCKMNEQWNTYNIYVENMPMLEEWHIHMDSR